MSPPIEKPLHHSEEALHTMLTPAEQEVELREHLKLLEQVRNVTKNALDYGLRHCTECDKLLDPCSTLAEAVERYNTHWRWCRVVQAEKRRREVEEAAKSGDRDAKIIEGWKGVFQEHDRSTRRLGKGDLRRSS